MQLKHKPRYLTPAQLAKRWHKTEKTLSNWRSKGTGPYFFKVGDDLKTDVLYPRKLLIAYENARTVGSIHEFRQKIKALKAETRAVHSKNPKKGGAHGK